MGLKKSLGYSPLGEPKSDDSQFNFVADRKPAGAENVTSIFKEADDRPGGMKLANSFSEKVMSKAEENERRPEKKVASYYLEKETLKRLKLWAENQNVSYSSVVEQAIQKHLVSVDEG
jgi:predicted HicB family RNase H-like nuclease